jgi:hypothetical protein
LAVHEATYHQAPSETEEGMFTRNRIVAFLLVAGLLVTARVVGAQETTQSERETMYRRYLDFPSKAMGGWLPPHWMADGSSFWYAEGGPTNTVIYKVDPRANTRLPLFDAPRMRKALAAVLGHEPPYQGLPFEEFTFLDG